MRATAVIALALLLSAPAYGGDEPPKAPVAPPATPAPPAPAPTAKPSEKPLTPEQAADAVLAAVKANDDAALKALAAKDDPDPWLVGDELIRRREFDVADAFARAAPRVDVEKLPDYVASRRGMPDDAVARSALAAANASLAAQKPTNALEILGLADSAPPADVAAVRRAFGRGLALAALGRLEEAAAAFLAAADAAERAGWLSRASRSLRESGMSAYRRSDFRGALAAWEKRLGICEARRDRAGVAGTLGNIGAAHDSLGNYLKALEHDERALKLMEDLGDRKGAAETLGNIGGVLYSLGNRRRALEYDERALKMNEDLGDRAGVAAMLVNIGGVHHSLGNYPKALEYHERALKVREDLGDRAGAAKSLSAIGTVHHSLGNYPMALEYHERALKMEEDLGDRAGVASTLGDIGLVHRSLGNHPKSLGYYERALEMMEILGNRVGVSWVLGSIGNAHRSLGNYPKALDFQQRALQMKEDLGDRAGVATTLGNIGNVNADLGNYPKALDFDERALRMMEEIGDRAGVARTLGNIGSVHYLLGDYPKALEFDKRALKLKEDIGDRAGVALTLGNIGNLHRSLENYPMALEFEERALRMMEELGDRAGVARALGNIGLVHGSLGNYPKALEFIERALQLQVDVGDRAGAALTLGNIGSFSRSGGNLPRALTSLDRAAGEAERIRADPILAFVLRELAVTQLTASDPVRASSTARRGVALLERMLGGLGDEQGAQAREPHTDVYGVGALAAARNGDAGEAAFFLESGRAGSLLESLGSREILRAQWIPESLLRVDAEARAAEAMALARYTKALDGGDLADIRGSLATLDAARGGVHEVVERIQREAKRAAGVVYPHAARAGDVQQWLGQGEALILYGLCLDEAIALVLTRDEARIVPLGKVADVTAACEALDLRDTDVNPEAEIAALKRSVVDPLGLREGVTRVLVSPEGPLSYVPMATLFAGREVAYVPSGTTYVLLLEDKATKGEQVLALGDPDYTAKFNPTALNLYAPATGAVAGPTRRPRLSPLPGTRIEATAVGDVRLLGKDASESGLRAVLARKRDRWHAVHFACHGLVNPDRPTLSSLALTPDAENDGFLTVLEVFRSRIPADLVVLSACETAKGKVIKGEGIMGLTRAFMFAGAPRVICSLWKVDDDATQALMTKFYELWNPKDGRPGLPTAEALRKAQEFVKSHEKWKHPYFWAAWVLWGLPD